MTDRAAELRELDADTVRELVVQSGCEWPTDNSRESRLFRFHARRIATEAFRRGVESKKRRPTWTSSEDELIREMFSSHSIREIAERLNRSKTRVHARAAALGLRKNTPHVWTAAEVEVLRQRYPHEAAKYIARDLRVSLYSVHGKARKLGLAKSAEFLSSQKRGWFKKPEGKA